MVLTACSAGPLVSEPLVSSTIHGAGRQRREPATWTVRQETHSSVVRCWPFVCVRTRSVAAPVAGLAQPRRARGWQANSQAPRDAASPASTASRPADRDDREPPLSVRRDEADNNPCGGGVKNKIGTLSHGSAISPPRRRVPAGKSRSGDAACWEVETPATTCYPMPRAGVAQW
jgi:hypothetical protein